MTINTKKITELLAQTHLDDPSTCPPLPGVTPRQNQPAAVLIPIIKDKGKWKILFIKRTENQDDRHSGQIAFPGGRFDLKDGSLLNTALRETSEEIGLPADKISILGQSCTMITVTGYEVTPYVGIVDWPVHLKLSPEEVVKTLLIPLDWLAHPSNQRTEQWRSGHSPNLELPVIFFNEYEGEILWGATAQILVDFLEITQMIY